MQIVSFAIALLIATCASAYAQTAVSGTWRVEGVGPGFPWTLVLRVDARDASGMVTSCASNFSVAIDEGKVDGNTITFKCSNPGRTRTITFAGTVSGDELSLTWKKQIQNGDSNTSPDEAVFGDAAPPRIIARRILNAELLDRERRLIIDTDQVSGLEFAAGVNLLQKDVKINGRLFVPQKTGRVRAVIVAPYWGLGSEFYWNSQVRTLAQATESGILQAWIGSIRTNGDDMAANNDAAKGGADGLVLLLQRLAQESGHPELANTPLVFWGHSTAGPFGPSFAALHPERTVAFIRYHSGPTPGGDLKVIGHIPALFFCGGKDTGVDANGRSCTDSARALWASGRALGAPWTFAVEPDATHGDVKDLPKANDLLVPWITAVLRQRLSSDGSTLRAVTEGSAWLGNNRTGELALYGTFAGSKAEASWFPDEPSARGWQIVAGAAK